MTVTQTSLFAYQEVQPKIGNRHQQILGCLAHISTLTLRTICLNNGQISELTKLPINCVTPRVNELVKSGLIEQYKKAKDPETRRLAIFWKLKEVSQCLIQ